MELPDYNVTFVHIKANNNVLVDTISRLKTLNIYEEPLENITQCVINYLCFRVQV